MEKESVLSKDFPEKLRELRKRKGYSQEQLARKIGADLQRVSKYERGVIWPTLEILVRIASVFEVSMDYLIRDSENLGVSKIKNKDLLTQIEEIDQLSSEDQQTVFTFLDAFTKKKKFEDLVKS